VIRTIVIGLLLFLGFAVAFAPASLIRTALPAGSGVELLTPSGTVWRGRAELFVGGQPAGALTWSFRPVTILQGSLGYDVQLGGAEHALQGTVAAGPGAVSLTLAGQAQAAFVNRWLGPYDIAISGGLTIGDVELRVPYRSPAGGRAAGTVDWAGGPVRYRLGRRVHDGSLPPLVAYLGEGLEAVVYQRGGQTPLLTAELLPSGFARIGVTALFTRLAGNPWPGSHADHEVVLEVEEQLF
jgi:hypothetical protein